MFSKGVVDKMAALNFIVTTHDQIKEKIFTFTLLDGTILHGSVDRVDIMRSQEYLVTDTNFYYDGGIGVEDTIRDRQEYVLVTVFEVRFGLDEGQSFSTEDVRNILSTVKENSDILGIFINDDDAAYDKRADLNVEDTIDTLLSNEITADSFTFKCKSAAWETSNMGLGG